MKLIIRIASLSFGIAFSAAALVAWYTLDAVQATATLAPVVSDASTPTRTLIEAGDDTLTEVRAALALANDVVVDVGGSAGETADSLDEVAALMSEQIPGALSTLEESMPALIDTAAVIDDTMGALALLGVPYDPAIPFDTALRDVRDTLDGLPEAVEEQGAALSGLVPVVRSGGSDIAALGIHIEVIDLSLASAQEALDDYRRTVSGLDRVAGAGADLARYVPAMRAASVVMGLAGLVTGGAGWVLAGRVRPGGAV